MGALMDQARAADARPGGSALSWLSLSWARSDARDVAPAPRAARRRQVKKAQQVVQVEAVRVQKELAACARCALRCCKRLPPAGLEPWR
jgi:hypothetical protein